MVLAHAKQEISTGLDHAIGIAQRSCGSQRLRLVPGRLQIEPLVGKIGEHNRTG
jgi:hypothetical protein